VLGPATVVLFLRRRAAHGDVKREQRDGTTRRNLADPGEARTGPASSGSEAAPPAVSPVGLFTHPRLAIRRGCCFVTRRRGSRNVGAITPIGREATRWETRGDATTERLDGRPVPPIFVP
jgi:hypothetical protein